MHSCRLNLAGLSLLVETEQPLREEPAFRSFLGEAGGPRCTICFRQADTLPEISGELARTTAGSRTYEVNEQTQVRAFFAPPEDEPYAVSRCDFARGKAEIRYLEKEKNRFCRLSDCLNYAGLEGLLIRSGRLCFHAACIRTESGRGLLFSGPSGIGKSTQGELWCRYRNAELINGDRPILGKKGHVWTAWGSPYAGSSKCYVNKSCPISAVFLLRQAPSCSLRKLPLREAFRGIYAGITAWNWNRFFAEHALDMALDLAQSVPVFEFSCTPDMQAAEFLEQRLKTEGIL